MRETRVRFLGPIPGSGRSPGEGNGNPLQHSYLENSMDRGAWRATVYGVTKSWTQLNNFTFTIAVLFLLIWTFIVFSIVNVPIYIPTNDLSLALFIYFVSKIVLAIWGLLCPISEKAMASHSSTLAWKIPWTEEPSRLQSMGSLRVWHNWVTFLSLFTFMHWRRKWQPTPEFLPGESQGRESLVGCHIWGHTESDMTEVT